MATPNHSNFEELVREYVSFTCSPSNGWWPCYCEVCGDGSRTKGPRGGWLFQDDMAFFNCFNQGCEGSYSPDRENPLSNGMYEALTAFGIPMKDYKLLQLKMRQSAGKPSAKVEIRRVPVKTMPMPDHFYPLATAPDSDRLADRAWAYLERRKIDPLKYPFYLSTGVTDEGTDVREMVLAKGLKNRVIIPAFKDGALIYWQARDLTDKAKEKYLNPDVPRSNLMFGMDRLYETVKSPLFVTEGIFDAIHLNGVAVFDNKLTSQQAELLSRSPRRKVIVPDRKGDSKRLAEDAIRSGFGVSIPNWGGEKDVNAAVIRYGRLYVAKSIVDNIKFGTAAKLVVGMMK